jgi:DNA-binding Lrp family transcriptional regulator
MTHENKTALLDAEIINCIAGVGKATQRQVSKNILAPEATVRYRLRKLVENGRLDCTETRLSKIFTIPIGPDIQEA